MYRGRCSPRGPAQSSHWHQRKWHRTEPHGVRRNKQHLIRIGPYFFFSFSLYNWLNSYTEYLKATFHFGSLLIVRHTCTYWGARHWTAYYVGGKGRGLCCREIHPNPNPTFFLVYRIPKRPKGLEWLSRLFYLKLALRQGGEGGGKGEAEGRRGRGGEM